MSLLQYIKDTRSELKHVTWPTKKQTVVFTIVVIIASVLAALYLGFFDHLFSTVLTQLIG